MVRVKTEWTTPTSPETAKRVLEYPRCCRRIDSVINGVFDKLATSILVENPDQWLIGTRDEATG